MTSPVPESFRVDVRPDRSRVVVTPVGELDIATVPALETQVAELRPTGFEQLVIDLRELEFIDSTGLKLLLALRGEGPLGLIDGQATGPVARLFDLSGVRSQFEWLAPTDL
jgi:anti-sigma B factor antagonist